MYKLQRTQVLKEGVGQPRAAVESSAAFSNVADCSTYYLSVQVNELPLEW